jgi:hypothetical protein
MGDSDWFPTALARTVSLEQAAPQLQIVADQFLTQIAEIEIENQLRLWLP